jgi:Prion-inhibition and propagation
MAAIEPVSFTIGIVALASLFSTCIECFDYFKTGQHLEEEFEILLVKLDLEKTRLLIWGNAVGVLKTEDEGRAVELSEAPKAELIGRCLERINSLLSDTDKLQNEYGLQASVEAGAKSGRSSNVVSANSMNIFKTSYRRFWVRFASKQTRSGLLMRTKWAIRDKPKFESLIVHLRDFIDGLHQVLSVKRETQDQIVCDDIISILDLSKLRLVRSACEGSYATWSAVASEAIEASEIGTVDRRSIEEWMVDAEGIGDIDTATRLEAGGKTGNTDQSMIIIPSS